MWGQGMQAADRSKATCFEMSLVPFRDIIHLLCTEAE